MIFWRCFKYNHSLLLRNKLQMKDSRMLTFTSRICLFPTSQQVVPGEFKGFTSVYSSYLWEKRNRAWMWPYQNTEKTCTSSFKYWSFLCLSYQYGNNFPWRRREIWSISILSDIVSRWLEHMLWFPRRAVYTFWPFQRVTMQWLIFKHRRYFCFFLWNSVAVEIPL